MITRAATWAAYVWAVVNCLYVYLLNAGVKAYRVETASILFIALLLPRTALSDDPQREPHRWSRTAVLTLLGVGAILWLAVLAPLVRFPFLSDDFVFLWRYRTFAPVDAASHFFRPAFSSVFYALNQVGHGSPAPFHATAFILHLVSAAGVYVLARRLSRARGVAAIAAAVFLLNPTQLEATLWVSGLQETLWTCFVVLAALAYTCDAWPHTARIGGAALLAGIALSSKETAVCFILVLAVLDVVRQEPRARSAILGAYTLFAAEIGVYLWMRSRVVALVDEQLVREPSRYLLKQFLATPYRAFAFPWNADAVHVPALVTCAVAILLLTLLIVAARRPWRPLAAGPALVLVTTAPVAGYFFVGADLSSARYVYCACSGWALLVAVLISRAARSWKVEFAGAVLLVLALSAVLRANTRPWQIAAEAAEAVEAGARRGESPVTAAKRWETETGRTVTFNDAGLPDNYQGVYIFRNGFPEFMELISAR